MMESKFFKKIVALFLTISFGIQIFAITATATSVKTQYRYHRYIDKNGNVALCPYYGNWKYDTSFMKIQYTEWLSEPLRMDNGKYSCYTHVNQGKSCDKAGCVDVSCDTNRYIDKKGTYWYYEETRTIATSSEKDTSEVSSSNSSKLFDTPDAANDITNQIGAGIIEYAIDLTDAVVDTIAPEDMITFGKAILSYKESVKVLLNAAVIGKIEDKAIAKALWEISQETSSTKNVPDDILDYAGELFLEALEKQPNLWKPLIKTTITKSPRVVLYIASTGAGGKLLPLKLVLNVFETSADRYWELGEAIAAYRNVGGEHSDDIVRYYNGFLDNHYEALELVAKAALKDRTAGTTKCLDSVQNLAVAHENSKAVFQDSIDDILTWWFKVLHPERAKALENIKHELNDLKIDYEAYYWDIRNAS